MSSKNVEKKEQESIVKRTGLFEDVGRSIEHEMERFFSRPWPPAFELRLPFGSFPPLPEVRMPLCDVVDKGDRYEANLEVPGIEKEQIDVKATRNSVEVSGEHSEKKEEKRKNYLYNERSYKSFYRKIPVPEEIIPSKIEARVVNGVLNISMPKKTPSKTDEETKVEVK